MRRGWSGRRTARTRAPDAAALRTHDRAARLAQRATRGDWFGRHREAATMTLGISLANKCQLLFGAAIVLIITGTLLAPWILLGRVMDAGELAAARQIAMLWPEVASEEIIDATGALDPDVEDDLDPDERGLAQLSIRYFDAERLDEIAQGQGFAAVAARRIRDDPDADEHMESLRLGQQRAYRYARPVRDEAGALQHVVVVEHVSPRAAGQLFINRLYLLSAGLFAGGLAVLVFYLITTRLILGPVRELRDTAERVHEGNLGIRAKIETGDEFEQLGEAFNRMLANLETGQEQLRAANKTLDLKVTELAESNLALYEGARLKGEFLANVSHELRTPLNSIIGFAELLEEIAENERPGQFGVIDESQYAKRRRYLQNIVAAGRSLLEMINELLDMAKIEAGKVDLHVEPLNVAESCEALLALIRPQAERKHITLSLELPKPAPLEDGDRGLVIETDHRKLQQIVFNFLSNAVKFTPSDGSITLRAERLFGGDGEPRLRISVLDTGPGIAREDQDRIFDKFTQLEGGHTRQHPGTGLGLAICRELTTLIQGEIQLVSEEGRGSMFSVIVPIHMDMERAAEMTMRLSGRERKADEAENEPSVEREDEAPETEAAMETPTDPESPGAL
ncbi:MAG: HAMP domain-containing protein [Phycisphaeraceae bacterium]|nr:MAG: HAMP domain-containing protein [Phycisphaeraceae bacterium]